MRKALLASAGAALMLVPVAPVPAAADGCAIGSPNLVRDVTDCVTWLVGECSLGSPNIITEIMECLR